MSYTRRDTNDKRQYRKRWQYVVVKKDTTWPGKLDKLNLSPEQRAEVSALIESVIDNHAPLGLTMQPGGKLKVAMPSKTSHATHGSLALFNTLGGLRRVLERTGNLMAQWNGGIVPEWTKEENVQIYKVIRESEVK